MSGTSNCRLCLTLIPDAASAANVFDKLDDGISLAEHLDNLFNVLVGDYSVADTLKLVCALCVAKIKKCALGNADPQEATSIAEYFQSVEGKALEFVRAGQSKTAVAKTAANSPFGMTTPTQAKRTLEASASTSKKSKLDPEMEWLRSQPGTSGLSESWSGPKSSGKKLVIREALLDQGDEDNDETVVKTKCPFCKKLYVLNSALIKHIQTVHPEQQAKFKTCDTCQKSFLNAMELKAHKCPKVRRSGGWFPYRRFRRWWW